MRTLLPMWFISLWIMLHGLSYASAWIEKSKPDKEDHPEVKRPDETTCRVV